MPQATGELRRRIKGIRNTRKITKAMELVAASKMRRAVQSALAIRPYALEARTLLHNLSAVTHPELHPLLVERPVRHVLVVVFSSDRGLAGGLNSNLVRVIREAARKPSQPESSYVVFGRKAQDMLRRLNLHLTAVFPVPVRQPRFADILPAARIVLDAFRSAACDRVDMVWTDYRSPLVQKTTQRTLLPITEAQLEQTLAETAGLTNGAMRASLPAQEYRFEPSPDVVLEALLPRLTEMRLYHTLLEATASEHAARMLAMRNASDAAGDLIDALTLSYNQVRQAAITKDLSEISASRAALA